MFKNLINNCLFIALAAFFTQMYSEEAIIQNAKIKNELENFYFNTNVLVTGGAGFIGTYLVKELISLGAEVTVLDNLRSGDWQHLKSIKDRINFIHGDITDFETCLQATKNQKVIFHCAALNIVTESFENRKLCHDINVTGTYNLLEAAHRNKVERLIFSSSAAVYGSTEGLCSEDLSTMPLSPYGYSKFIGEIYCKQYAQLFNIKTLSLRYFNVFDPTKADYKSEGVIVAFKKAMSNNEPIFIFGDGQQCRDFVSVQKVVESNIRLAALPEEKIQGQVINIAQGKSITLLELIDQLKLEYPDYSGDIIFASERIGDVKRSLASCQLYNNLLE